ncbi:MAG TPA: carbohydrate-binding family 9-like protein [Thermoanaerobaculia bacterium]|nr:carbohydrate-binding family 9-like protein [Thermoanaerobaculia bacterium]
MTIPLPRWRVPQAPEPLDDDAVVGPWVWESIPRLPPLLRSDGGGLAIWKTAVRVCRDGFGLAVRFDCADRAAWGTLTERDDPLWQEEVVELFLALDAADPGRYFEFEVSPRGVLFDARVNNPTGQRADLQVETDWNCPGIRWGVGSTDLLAESTGEQDWWAALVLPWSSLAGPGLLPETLRANFYRIERPPDGPHEFSAWSPTLVDPPDFHQPARFGFLSLGDRIA